MGIIAAGIRIIGKLDPSAKEALRGLVADTERSEKAITKQANAAKASSLAIIKWNQGLNLAKKAMMGLERAFDMTVGQSIALRAETNANRVAWERLDQSLDHSSALIGDLLLPAAMGLKAAFAEAAKSITTMSEKEREAMAMDIAGWSIAAGQALISGLATGAKLASMSISGIRMAWATAKQGAFEFNNVVQKAFGGLIGLGAVAADKVGATGVRNALAKTATAYFDLGDASSKAADAEAASAISAMRDMENWNKVIDKAVDASGKFLQTAQDAARVASKGLGGGTRKSKFNVPGEDAKGQVAAYYEYLEAKAKEHLARDAQALGIKIANNRNAYSKMAQDAQLKDEYEQSLLDGLTDYDGQQAARRVAIAQLEADQKVAIAQNNMVERKAIELQLTFAKKEMANEAARHAKEKARESAETVKSTFMSIYSGIKGVIRSLVDEHEKAAQIMADTTLSYAEKQRKIQEDTLSTGEILGSAVLGLAESMMNAIAEVAAEYVAKKIMEAAITKATGTEEIAVNAGVAASGAAASQASIPIIGPILAIAAAAAIFAAVMAFANFNKGGIVPGDTPGAVRGTDSVPAMLTPGEGVLTESTTRAIARDLRGGGGGSARGGGTQHVGGNTAVVNVRIQTLERPSMSRWDSMVERDMAPAINKGIRRRAIRLRG